MTKEHLQPESELGAVRGMDGQMTQIGTVEEEASAARRWQDFCPAPPPDPAMAGVDRISQLPDDIINHILSFLPTTNLRARTSVLSKRWRHIWTHHPSIHLSFPLPLPSGADKDAAARAYFMAVLSCVKSCKALVLHQFSTDLWLPSSCTPAEAKIYADVADLWLRFAGLRAVRELRVCAKDPRSPYDGEPTIPGTLFCCDLVADLTVTDSNFPNVPPDFHGFRFLKSLHLSYGSIDDDTMADLLDCCPVLESLRVVGCRVLTEVVVPPWILPRLTHLDMFYCEDLLVASVEAPNLRSITYEGDLQCLYLKASPVEAALRHFTYAGDIDTQDDLMRLLLSISTVSVLSANTWFYQFAFTKPTVLNNLKELYLYIEYELTESRAKALVTNIGECPMLEKLDINLRYVQQYLLFDHSWPNIKYSDSLLKHLEEINERDWSNPLEFVGVPRCTLCYLKTVIIREFVGSKIEMCLANFLLQNAVALEKFVVFDFIECDDDQLEELLAPIPRASSQVQLELFPSKNYTQDYGLHKHSWIFGY